MFYFIILSSIFNPFTPYLRKHILASLDPHDYLFINMFIVFIITILYLLFKVYFQNHDLEMMIKKYKSLTILQICFIVFISIITIISTVTIMHLDKYFNHLILYSILGKILAAILFLLVGIFIFKEKYNYKQIIGLLFVIIGVLLLFCKD